MLPLRQFKLFKEIRWRRWFCRIGHFPWNESGRCLGSHAGRKEKALEVKNNDVWIRDGMTVQELAKRMKLNAANIRRTLRLIGHPESNNSRRISQDVADLVAMEHNFNPTHKALKREWKLRPPIVTIMGHVDHGKTTLLDMLRRTSIAAHEPGGITQHIGAFRVNLNSGEVVTFIDTPGHALFSTLRQRGADVTDIVVLVVAADDGVMQQTVQSIKFSRKAKVPVIVAINKIDKRNADITRAKQDLLQHGIQLEEFGGDVQAVSISALENINIELLIEAILAQAELLDLRAHVNKPAEGIIIESSVDKGKGTFATTLVQQGVLAVGDIIVAGSAWARVRHMVNDAGEVIKQAGASMPVRVSGWRGLPSAGEGIIEVDSEQEARNIAAAYNEKQLFSSEKTFNLESEEKGSLPLVVKADTQGSLEALAKSLATYDQVEATMSVISSGVGNVSDSDVDMAAAAEGAVIGFNVKVNAKSTSALAKEKNVTLMFHKVIYHLLSKIKEELTARLPDYFEEVTLGEATILQMFKLNGRKKAVVAGCRVKKGSLVLHPDNKFRIVRGEDIIYEGRVSSLKHHKEDVTEAKKETECGVSFSQDAGFREGDKIQCFTRRKAVRTVDWKLDF